MMRHQPPVPIDGASQPLSRLSTWIGGPSESARIFRFSLIGGISTLLYAAVALLLSSPGFAGLDATPASVAAYLTGGVFSYCGHRIVTFMSDGAVGFEIVRFAAATVAGLALSTLLAAVLTDLAGLPVWIPVVLACVLVPVINFIIFRSYVFVGRTDLAT